jgi:hypothetical protein
MTWTAFLVGRRPPSSKANKGMYIQSGLMATCLLSKDETRRIAVNFAEPPVP